MNISSNISSIQNTQTMMNQSAVNVSNISQENSQTDLAKEMTDQITFQNTTSADVTAIRTEDEMLGTLLDLKA